MDWWHIAQWFWSTHTTSQDAKWGCMMLSTHHHMEQGMDYDSSPAQSPELEAQETLGIKPIPH